MAGSDFHCGVPDGSKCVDCSVASSMADMRCVAWMSSTVTMRRKCQRGHQLCVRPDWIESCRKEDPFVTANTCRHPIDYNTLFLLFATAAPKRSSVSWCHTWTCCSHGSEPRPGNQTKHISKTAQQHPPVSTPMFRGHKCQTHQIKSPPDQMIPHTRTVLTPPAPHQHHAVLLYIMPFSGNIGRNDLPTGQTDFSGLALARIRLFGLRDAHFQTHPFHLGTLFGCQGGRHGVASFLRASGLRADLVQGRGARGRRAEETGS